MNIHCFHFSHRGKHEALSVDHQHRATTVSATGIVLAQVWATSGKPDLGHQRAVIRCGMWAMCKHLVWVRSGPYQFCCVGQLAPLLGVSNGKATLEMWTRVVKTFGEV